MSLPEFTLLDKIEPIDSSHNHRDYKTTNGVFAGNAIIRDIKMDWAAYFTADNPPKRIEALLKDGAVSNSTNPNDYYLAAK